MDKDIKKRFKRIEQLIKQLEDRLKELESERSLPAANVVHSQPVDAQEIWRGITSEYQEYTEEEEYEEYNINGYL